MLNGEPTHRKHPCLKIMFAAADFSISADFPTLKP